VRELDRRGHDVLFLERDVPWYRDNRDLPNPPYGRTALYESLTELWERFGPEIVRADAVIVGSYVPDGIAVSRWIIENASGIKVFYDIDTPVTLARLARGDCAYLSPDLVPRFDLYLSFTGGPTLRLLEERHGAKRARALYCSVDPALYHPEHRAARWDLGYLGTYSDDRQPTLERLLIEPARRGAGRFVVAGPQYPATIDWPEAVERIEHLPPKEHRAFYTAQRFTLNVTRQDMVRAGYAPSVRLFEAAACGVPIVSDRWAGLETLFEPGREVVIADDARDVIAALTEMPEDARIAMGRAARERVLREHTAAHRAAELLHHIRVAQRETEAAPRPPLTT
jgi:spore maturation protein CgeB